MICSLLQPEHGMHKQKMLHYATCIPLSSPKESCSHVRGREAPKEMHVSDICIEHGADHDIYHPTHAIASKRQNTPHAQLQPLLSPGYAENSRIFFHTHQPSFRACSVAFLPWAPTAWEHPPLSFKPPSTPTKPHQGLRLHPPFAPSTHSPALQSHHPSVNSPSPAAPSTPASVQSCAQVRVLPVPCCAPAVSCAWRGKWQTPVQPPRAAHPAWCCPPQPRD